jgi:hypothetical protein
MTMTDEPVGHALEIRAQPLLPMAPTEAAQVMRAYQETCRAILTKDDVQRVGDREFTTRSGFQKLAAAYGVSTEIVSVQVKHEQEEDGTHIMVARAVVRAIHPSGRHAEGDGACSQREKRFRKGDEKMDHSLPATAVTRATNRAVSNLVAFGTVSAEEAESSLGPGGPAGSAPLPGWAAHMSDNAIPLIATNLTRVLMAAGVDDPAVGANTIGQDIFELCDGGFPFALARLAKLLADAAVPVDEKTGEVLTASDLEIDGALNEQMTVETTVEPINDEKETEDA